MNMGWAKKDGVVPSLLLSSLQIFGLTQKLWAKVYKHRLGLRNEIKTHSNPTYK